MSSHQHWLKAKLLEPVTSGRPGLLIETGSMSGQSLDRERSFTATPSRAHTPYGKACLNCVRSKTKCTISNNGEQCERCLRLNKDCQVAPRIRKKREPKKPKSLVSSVVTKTAALEEKVNGIFELLQRPRAPDSRDALPSPDTSDTNANSVEYKDPESAGPSLGDLFRAVSDIPHHNPAYTLPTPSSSCTLPPSISLMESNDGVASPSSATHSYPPEDERILEGYLETFRTRMVPYIPAVCIRTDVTVDMLRRERPFLWLVIRSICNKDPSRQAALGREVRETLGREMILEGEKNLDLFLGALVFAAWGHYYILTKPIQTLIIQLCISLALDLGLTKPLAREPVRVMLNYTARGCPKPVPNTIPVRTMEERRAMVGLFLISSIYANYFQRIEPIHWTPYLDECLRLLEEKQDFPTDKVLVCVVRLQLLCNRIVAVPWNEIPDGSDGQLPQNLFSRTYKSQLEEIRHSVTPELSSNNLIQLSLLYVDICIHEHGLFTSLPKDVSYDPTFQLDRIESLWTCLTKTKAWLAIFLSLDSFPLSSYPHLSLLVFSKLAHCLVLAFSLSIFKSPDIMWDRRKVRAELDFGEVVKLLSERWGGVPAAARLGPGDLWTETTKRFHVLDNWWVHKVAPMIDAEEQAQGGQELNLATTGCGSQGLLQTEALDFSALDMFLDDPWMREMLEVGY